MKRRLSILLIVTMLATIMLGGCGKSTKDVNVAATTEENAKESENTTDDVEVSELNEEASDGATDIGTAAFHEISVKEKWEGTWYGFMSCEGSTGIYEPYNGDIYGCYMVVEFDSDTTGQFTMYDDVGEFENATFVAAGDMLIAQEGTTLGAPMNVSNFILVNSNAEPDLVVIDDEYLDGDDILKYSLHLKPWGVRWEGEESKDYYDAAIKDYIAMLDSNEAPKYGWVNPVYGEAASQAVAKADSSDDIDSSVSDTDVNEAASSTQSATDPNAVDPDNYVIVDNDMFKITVTGVGAYEYNADWIGYTLIIESKTDYTLGFGSTAEEYALDADIYSIKNNTCYYNGEMTETHFKTMVKAGATDDKTVLAIDGITDVSQVKNVKGYIKVWNNETGGSDIIGYYPYSFK